ncbi:unnamed protein product [Rhizophagus irregularis]|nr:unnamed protein product [Rhizophagus irregularis]
MLYNNLNISDSFPNTSHSISQNPDHLINEEHITNLHVINQENINDNFFIDYIKIGSINIQTAFNNKLNNIINYFVGHNFDILGLSETGFFGDRTNININKQKHKHPTLPNNFIYIIHDTSGQNKGSGVAIMITDKMEKHLHHTEFHEGRIINLIFGFKKSKQLNVTCCYLPASPKNDITKSQISAICIDQLNKLIIKSNNTKNSYAIVIGDFNVQTKHKSDPNYPSIRSLKNNGYKDMIKYHQESLDNNSTHNTNRIDYHFGNTYLLEQSIHSYTQSIPHSFFNTDHNIVIILLEKTFFDSRNKHLFDKFMNVLPFNKRNDEVKKSFKYAQKLWSSYTNRSHSTFKKRFSKEPQQINNKTSLNRQWDLFEKTLIELKEDIIPQTQTHHQI